MTRAYVPPRLEDYALIGDLHTAALVSREGSIDWLCLPRFDSAAAFAALLGDAGNGRWSISPVTESRTVGRAYRDDTLVLETTFTVEGGAVRLIDFMPPRDQDPTVVRIVDGISGEVPMEMELIVRFDYGSVVPWVRQTGDALLAVGGPDSVWLWSDVQTSGRDLTTVAEFTIREGERATFTMMWRPSHRETRPRRPDPSELLESTISWWSKWASACGYRGEWRSEVVRSLITLKSLIYQPTGGIVAAPTTSLPERIGGVRNWDYRYCWVRDATFTLYALMLAGYRSEAEAWRDWLLRAVAGDPGKMQIMYGPAGERRLTELELGWLSGYEGSLPVRVGNDASGQFQLDVFGELMDAMHQARFHDIAPEGPAWDLQLALMEILESRWSEPDDGIWEIRGPRRHFTHSKVMAWVAVDRAVKALESFGLEGDLGRWRALRLQIHEEVCERGFNADLGSFTQYYDGEALDASLLMIPLVGFLPPRDPRVTGTVRAVEERLMRDGLVMRYLEGDDDIDGLPGDEGAFLPCSFWLADNLWLGGREEDARELFTRLIGSSNDVGLFSEELEPTTGRLLGNFPQAFTHVSMINTAHNISGEPGPSHIRSGS